MLKVRLTLTLVCVVMVGMAFGVGNIALALPIEPGFDLFHTLPGTYVPLPGIGNVDLEGVPIGPGNTDTIVQRKTGLPDFATGLIDIELVALFLKSVDPILDLGPLNPLFAGQSADLYATVNAPSNDDGVHWEQLSGIPVYEPDPTTGLPLPSSLGTINVTSHDHVGDDDTFNSNFDVNGGVWADLIFTTVGGDPSNIGDVLFHTHQSIPLSSIGSTWSHTPPPNDQHNAVYPAGNFYVTEIDHVGPHLVEPSTPEPSTILLLGAGIVGLFGVIYRQRRKGKKS
jgi:hypothetical protein